MNPIRIDTRFCGPPIPENAILLLRELTAAIKGTVEAGSDCVLLSWRIAHQGRKHTTGSALYDENGAWVGMAHGVWTELPEPPATAARARR